MIKLANLSKYYYSANSVALGLRKVNLDFAEKEFVVITGESGSGKTTLLSTISGLLPYEEGELYIEGKPTSHFDDEDWESYRKEYIAFVFQNYNLIDSYTVLENVMAVLLIQGIDKKTARETALNYLEKVGLTDYITHHASELSSGQKQRLSIARALAKNTKIIVADEPTGNLDAENGKQVMELLSKLAEDRLVLVVTHNYEEAAPFATRKVRIYDGEVVEDIQIRRNTQAAEPVVKAEDEGKNRIRLSERKIVQIFTKIELGARKKRGILFTSLLFFVAVASFLFLGSVLANLDDTSTRIYTNEAFLNIDELRIAVRHADGAPITDADLEIFKGIKNVVQVEEYGFCNDINYFCEEGKDYTINYVHENAGFDNEGPDVFSTSIYLQDYSKFVRSASGLTEADLACGSLPQSTNEVVIYTEDSSLLGTTFQCYFADTKNWNTNTYCTLNMTICGILKEETTQYYFSEELAKMVSLSGSEDMLGLYNDRFIQYIETTEGIIVQCSTNRKWEEVIFYKDDNYEAEEKYHIVLSEELMKERLPLNSFTFVVVDKEENVKAGYDFLLLQEIIWPCLNVSGMGTSSYQSDRGPAGMLKEASSVAYHTHLSSDNFVILSEEFYDEITSEVHSTQGSVFVSDYAYVNDVIRALNKAGYEAVSPYRLGAVSYDSEKVMERLVTLGLSLAALLVLLVLEVFILKALLKNGKNDCIILKSIGMEQHILSRVQRNTLVWYCLGAFVPMLVAALLLNMFVPQVHALVVYYRIYHWIILLGLNLAAVLFAAFLHNRYLKQLIVAGIE